MEQLTNMQMPVGTLGSLFAGEQAAQAEMLNTLQARSNLEKLNRDIQMNPLDVQVRQKDAAFAQDEMNNPELRKWRMQGMIGKDMSSDAAGRYDQATYDDKLKAGIAEYASKTSKSQLEQDMANNQRLYQGLQQIEMMGNQAGWDGAQFIPFAAEMATKMGAPKELVQAFAQAAPQDRAKMLTGIKEALGKSLIFTPQILAEMAKSGFTEGQKGFWHERVARIQAQAQMAAANAKQPAEKAAEIENDLSMVAATGKPPTTAFGKQVFEGITDPNERRMIAKSVLERKNQNKIDVAAGSAAAKEGAKSTEALRLMKAFGLEDFTPNPDGSITGVKNGKLVTIPANKVGVAMSTQPTPQQKAEPSLPPGVTKKD